MPISFETIPQNWKQPLYWVEVDGSKAGYPRTHLRSLLVGTMITSTKKVSDAAVVVGGTGYVVGNTINLGFGVVVTVATVTTGAVTTVTVTDAGSAAIGAVPDNPVLQVSSNGPGTGAAFDLTWIDDVVSPNSGVAVPDVPVICGRQMDADYYFGRGSELANAFKAYFRNNFANEVWGVGVAEPLDGGAQASGTITISNPPNEAGTIHLYVAGTNVRVNIGATNTPTEIAAAIADKINDLPDLPVTATASVAVVTLTCKWRGTSGNDIRMMDSYFGRIGGETLPPGMILTYSGSNPLHPKAGGQLAGGVGVPDFANVIANLGETEFEYVSLGGYTDSTSLLAWEGEWDFSDQGRWGWMRQLYGHLFAARRGTYSDLISFGLTRNGKILSVMGVEVTALDPVYEWAAAYCAKAARGLINDPARPLQTLHLEGIFPAPFHERFNLGELNALASSGICTQRTLSDNVPMISRESTTYQVNLYGQGDDAFELVTTLATLAKLIRNQRHAITTKFPRHKLANDGTRFGAGQAIVTPKIVKAELVAQYRADEFIGLVEDAEAFKANLIVERDPNDPNRLNVLYPPDLVNQLRIFAVLNQFRLQYNRGIDSEIIGSTPI
jgi:phage tail sheath gpL-like